MRTLEEIKGRCFIDVDGHWLWRGATFPNGAPKIWAPEYTKTAGGMITQCGYRAVWNITNMKPVPEGMRVFRTCDEAACCNPDHVKCLPVKDYGRQQARKGTLKGQATRILANRAIGRKRAKVTPELMDQILASSKPIRVVAEEIGLSMCTVWRVRTGKFKSMQPTSAGMCAGLLAQGRP